jgi:hypothetical protein
LPHHAASTRITRIADERTFAVKVRTCLTQAGDPGVLAR